jgi:predicted phage baseplate assembly protein
MNTASTRWGDLVVSGDARRQRIREREGNGVDGIEVRDEGRELLVYFLRHTPDGLDAGNIRIEAPAGARAVRAVRVRPERHRDRELEDRLVVELDTPGTAGRYQLRIVERGFDGEPGLAVHRGIDPRYAEAGFRFDVDAPTPPLHSGAPGAAYVDDGISYLGRDFAGLKQLMLSRMAVTAPQWTETHEPDLWIALVELLAYVGDDLSYYEDAVATEAYLQTARRRVSIKRHARLLDYRLDDGCAARAWVCVEVGAPFELPLDAVCFAALGTLAGGGAPVVDGSTNPPPAWLADVQQYSPLPPPVAGATVQLLPAHNAITLWSWGESDSHLVLGATRAVVIDAAGTGATIDALPQATRGRPPARALALGVGDVLVLEQTLDPASGGTAPADPTLRQAVRLTRVRELDDELFELPLLEIEWDEADALAFELGVTASGRFCARACANVVLVEHGASVEEAVLLAAPRLSQPNVTFSTPFPDAEAVAARQALVLRGLYREWRAELEEWLHAAERGTPITAAQLQSLRDQFGKEIVAAVGLGASREHRGDATWAALGLAELLARGPRLLAARLRRAEVLAALAEASGPLEPVVLQELSDDWGSQLGESLDPSSSGTWGPAAPATTQDPDAALPVLTLTDPTTGATWSPAVDLIGVAPTDRAVVADVDDQRYAALRLSAPPAIATTLTASYRVGNGSAGNVVAEAISALVWTGGPGASESGNSGIGALGSVTLVRNPLPASGGTDPESTAAARLAIPGSLKDAQPRALTADDYASLATAVPGVAQAGAELRSTGAQTLAEVAVQPALGDHASEALMQTVARALAAPRRIGHVVRVSPARYRGVVVGFEITLNDDTIRRLFAEQVALALSSGWLPNGTAAVFNPVNLSFGQTLYASPVIGAVHALAGVEAAVMTRFGFVGEPIPAPSASVPDALTLGALEFPRLDNDPADPWRGYALVELKGGRG